MTWTRTDKESVPLVSDVQSPGPMQVRGQYTNGARSLAQHYELNERINSSWHR